MASTVQAFYPVRSCIYRCRDRVGSEGILSREHVLPYGIGGTMVLPRASCEVCRTATGQLEERLLHGPWWPLRIHHGLPSRRPDEQPDTFFGTLETDAGIENVEVPADEYPGVLILQFPPPSIIQGMVSEGLPTATQMYFKYLSGNAITALTQRGILVPGTRNLNLPINLSADDLVRFLAKVALSYAVGQRGLDAFESIYVREIICGQTEGANTYVGGASSPLIGPLLPGTGLHALMDYVHNQDLCVYIQIFRATGDPPPIYEVVVGRLRGK